MTEDTEEEKPCYFPLFCLAKVPPEVGISLQSILVILIAMQQWFEKDFSPHMEEYTPILEITSDHPSLALKESEFYGNSNGPNPTPFLGCSVNQVYDFFKASLRPAGESKVNESCTYFSFIAIDEECLRSEPPQCIVCSDAPDFGEAENEMKLKTLRMDIVLAFQYLCALEQLSLTPSELNKADGWVMAMMPPAIMNEDPDSDSGSFRIATLGQARQNKRRGIQLGEMTAEEYHRAGDRITLTKVPRLECIKVGIMMSESGYQARKLNYSISLYDNRSEKTRHIKAKPVHMPVSEQSERSAQDKYKNSILKKMKRIIKSKN